MRKIQIEHRDCKECGQTYDWNLRNIFGLCPVCRKKHYNRQARLKESEYKKPYPLAHVDKIKRHRRLVSELNKTETKAQRRAIYNRELDWIMSNGIWEWCVDLRISNTVAQKGGKVGRPNKINKALPDTRNWHDEEC